MPKKDDAHSRALCADVSRTRRGLGRFGRRLTVAVASLGLITAGIIISPTLAAPAYAVSYPSWEDVEKAKANESAKAGEITRIESLITQLQNDVARTQAEARAAGDAYYEAQQALQLAAGRAEQLQAQADKQTKAADSAAKKAGEVAAQLYRTGGDDTALQLFFSDSAQSADDILSRLGQMDMLLEHNRTVYDSAVTARDNAKSLSEQAEVQRKERDRLEVEAQKKFEAAQAAQQAAESALQAQNENLDVLQAQLAALKDNTTKVVADYKAGVEAARKAEEARKAAEAKAAREAAEAARRAAEEAAKQAANNNSGGGGGGSSNGGGGGSSNGGGGGGGGGASNGGGGGGAVSSGWARPSDGWQTSGYGYRYGQCGPNYCASTLHAGTDLAAGCGAYIYAAHSGTVTYSGYNGGYGNYIRIDNGDGVGTGYGHIQYGGLLVGNGQWVQAGQAIALEGQTGNSFGCHVHFEVYVGGGTTDPVPFMAARGVYI